MVHLTQFGVIRVGNGPRLGSGGAESRAETSHGSTEPSFPRACKTQVGIMSLGLKRKTEMTAYLPLKLLLMSLSSEESFRSFFLSASEGGSD